MAVSIVTIFTFSRSLFKIVNKNEEIPILIWENPSKSKKAYTTGKQCYNAYSPGNITYTLTKVAALICVTSSKNERSIEFDFHQTYTCLT